MSEIVRMRSVEPVLFGVVKIVWLDGFEAIVDLRPVIAVGELFAFLREAPQRFGAVGLDEFGTRSVGSTTKATKSISGPMRFAVAPNVRRKSFVSPAERYEHAR